MLLACREALGREQRAMIRRRPLALAAGARLVQPIAADRPLPSFDRVTMDGYAVRSADIAPRATLRLLGTTSAGQQGAPRVLPGGCVAITTGSPLPDGADAVIPLEQAERTDSVVTVTSPSVQPFHNIHRQGADAALGQVLLECGEMLDPARIAIAAAVGVTRPLVRAGVPSVRVLSSGDEIRPAATSTSELAPGQIRDSNLHALAALVPMMGGRVESTRHVPDDLRSTCDAVEQALHEADVIVTIGGVSAGPRDHFPPAFAECGVSTIVHGVNLQPGKPILVGVADRADFAAEQTWRPIVLALPGNPASVMVTAHLFLWPVLRLLAGSSSPLPWERRVMCETARPNPKRESFRPASLDGSRGVRVVPWSGSGDLVHLRHAEGVARLPAQDAPISAGSDVAFLPWAWRRPAPTNGSPS